MTAEVFEVGLFEDTEFASSIETAEPGFAMAAAMFAELSAGYEGFAKVRAQQIERGTAADQQLHRANMLDLDRRQAERQARSILRQGEDQVAAITLEGGQRRAQMRTRAAASGFGGASAREAQLSEKLIQDLEVYHVKVDTARRAGAARSEAVRIGNRALFARTSAQNLQASAELGSPEASLALGAGRGIARALRISEYRSRRG